MISVQNQLEQMVYFQNYVVLYLKKHVYRYIFLYFILMSFMVIWFGPTQPNLIQIESSNYKNGTFAEFTEYTDPLFSELKLLKVTDIFSLTKLLFMLDFINENVLEELKTIFVINRFIHSYETRSSMVFHILKTKT